MGLFRRALDDNFHGRGTAVMGVFNATPDSFYDGGIYVGERAVARIGELARAGAFVIDIGGESTRPGAPGVCAKEQLERIEPAVKSAVAQARHQSNLWISVDTSDPSVAETALGWGVHVINDVSCLADVDLARVTARGKAALLMMHARGPMAEMHGFSEYPECGYSDIVGEVTDEWRGARERAIGVGVPAEDILFDPGFGFAKSAAQSMELLRRIGEFETLGAPVVVGPGRKSFLNLIDVRPAAERLGATIVACLYAAKRGVRMVRVHDVLDVHQALQAQRLFAGWQNAPDIAGNRCGSVGVEAVSSEGACLTPC